MRISRTEGKRQKILLNDTETVMQFCSGMLVRPVYDETEAEAR